MTRCKTLSKFMGLINNSPRRVILDTRKKPITLHAGLLRNGSCRLLSSPTRRGSWGSPSAAVTRSVLAAVVLLGLASSLAGSSAHATSVDFSLVVPKTPTLQITLGATNATVTTNPTTVTMQLTPNIDNTAVFGTSDIAVTVATSNTTGYYLNMSTTSTTLTSGTNMVPSIASTYTCTAATATSCNFTVNRWGYRLSTDTANTFKPVPNTGGTDIAHGTSATNGVTTTVQLGARIDNTLPAGTYATTINFTATANPAITINNLTYMQDFKTLANYSIQEIKDSMTVNTQYQLIDNRDNKTYYIAKLETSCSNPRVTASSDSKCYQIWMTQNLDLDLISTSDPSPSSSAVTSIVAPLTSENTDLNSCGEGIYIDGYYNVDTGCTWVPSMSTITNRLDWQDLINEPVSFEPYTVYYYQGQSTASTSCDSSPTCSHWHAGNYYNWSAAVASNDTTSMSTQYQQMENSICPAGWQLPNGDTDEENLSVGAADYAYLLYQNGIIISFSEKISENFTTNGYTNVQGSPLFMVNAGTYISQRLYHAGTMNYLRSGTSYAGNYNSYAMHYENSVINVYGVWNHPYGFSVRCLVRE